MNQEITRPSLTNLEAEQALLGAIFINNDAFNWCGSLSPDHFSEPLHARIFDVISKLITAGRLVTPVTLKNHFETDETMVDVNKTMTAKGGASYLARLAASATTTVNTSEYARLIRDLYVRRAAMNIASEALEDLQGLPIDVTSSDFAADLAQRMSSLAMEGEERKSRFSLGEALASAIDTTAAAYQNWGQRPDTISTGLKSLDEILGGFVKGKLVIIAGRPAMGKSTLALTLAYEAAKHGRPADFYSLEMSRDDLAQRAASIEHRIPYERVSRGKITEKEFERVVENIRPMLDYPLTIIERGKMTLSALAAEIAKSKMRPPNLSLVIVDQLSKLRASASFKGPRYEEVTAITAELPAIAKQHDVCMVVLQQLSRDVDKRDNKRPQMADLRDSASIEQDADVIIFAYREAYYLARNEPRPNTTEHMEWQDKLDKCHNKMELIVAKNRMGREGTATVNSDMPINLITDIVVDLNMKLDF